VSLAADKTEATWFTYTEGNPSREYEVAATFQTKEGAKLERPKQTTLTDRLVIDAPFGDQLDVTFVPQGTFPPLASIVLSVKYEDEVAKYHADEVHVFTTTTDVWSWKVRVPDPTKRGFQYKIDLTYVDGAATQGDWVDGAEGTVLVGEIASQMLEVEVVAGALDMTKWKLVVVRLKYQDAAGAVQDETFQVTPANAADSRKWKIALKDPAVRTYTYEVQAFGVDGATKQTVPPTTSEDSLLVLELP
jgi:hypothetical protein